MKKKYTTPAIQIRLFKRENIVTSSGVIALRETLTGDGYNVSEEYIREVSAKDLFKLN